jgi:hypothetical protein
MFSSIALQLIDISDLFPNYPLETGEATPKAYWQWRAQVKVQVEGKQDRVGKVELERLEQGHLGDLFRRHLRLLDF